jgi:hypothetical protein
MRRPLLGGCWWAVLVATIISCSDPVEPNLGTLAYEIFTGCLPSAFEPVYTCSPQQTTITRGDTLLVGHLVVDTSVAMAATARVRAPCAANFEIRRGVTLVGTLPAVPTCPDSVMEQGDNPPLVNNRRVQFWAVPSDAAPGVYTITSVLLVEPRAARSTQVTVQ